MSIDIDSLIEKGKDIRRNLRYVDPPTNVWRTFDMYKLENPAEYHSWAFTCYRFLQNDTCNKDFKFAMDEFELKSNHLCPEPLDKMIGILESYKFLNKIQCEITNNALTDGIELIERDRELYASYDIDSCNKSECIELYHKWYSSSLVLFKRKLNHKDEDLIKFEDVDNSHNGFGLRDNYHQILAPYLVLLDKLKYNNIESSSMETGTVAKMPLLFISHSSKDEDIVKQIVTLLQTLGFNKTNLFCSSIEGYGIDVGDDIYDTLRSKFKEYNIYVLFVLSENYYASPACLNEMGAAWILQSDYFVILSSGFQIPKIKGAINPNKMAIIVDDKKHIRSSLNSFKSKLVNIFDLPHNDDDIVWEDHRNEFIKNVCGL